jgi:hypothetical protein
MKNNGYSYRPIRPLGQVPFCTLTEIERAALIDRLADMLVVSQGKYRLPERLSHLAQEIREEAAAQ